MKQVHAGALGSLRGRHSFQTLFQFLASLGFSGVQRLTATETDAHDLRHRHLALNSTPLPGERSGAMNRRDTLKIIAGAWASLLANAAVASEPGIGFPGRPADSAPCTDVSDRPRSQKNAPAFEWLTLGDVKPAGWIKEQMTRDLQQGYAGKLGKLCHEASSDIFVTNRNSLARQNTSNQDGVNWWNGETEGVWRSGHIMMAYLSEDPESMREAEAWVRHVLTSQDADGYLGAFAPDLRYKRLGELWTQSCLLTGLLAYAELTGSKDAMQAVIRSSECTMAVLGPGKAEPPWGEDHDLVYGDILERLHDLTGDPKYLDFALWLYESWSTHRKTSDNSLSSLLNRKAGWVDHGAHTYETMRAPLWLSIATGRLDLGTASRNSFAKLDRYTSPGGSAVSQELILDQSPDPTLSEYEYCATKQIQFTLESALQKTGNAALGDRVERIWFNAAQGSRLANGSAITYLTEDNRLTCNGRKPDGSAIEKRNKFSPTHQDVAVCCNPASTHVAALYVRGMWMSHPEGGLAAMLYGPCKLSTVVERVPITLEERTNYPFENQVQIVVRPEKEVRFPIFLRDPGWSKSTMVQCEGAQVVRQGDYIVVTKSWKADDQIHIDFVPVIQEIEAVNGEFALQYGPLIFARAIPSAAKVVRTYPLQGFEDTYLIPIDDPADLSLCASTRWQGFGFTAMQAKGGDPLRPFDDALLKLEGSMTGKDGNSVKVSLVPMGNAPGLRRVTFPVA